MEAGSREQAPVWLLGRLEAQRVGPALVLSLQPPLTEGVADQTRRAVRDVRRVLTGWDGGLVVVLPETTAQLEELLAADDGAYDSIAAVTASADGRSDPTAPVRVVLNPPVFLGLGPIAGQVVLSHEATHAATGATYRDMPLWLVEGFGDYVALAGEPVPLETAAGQALETVREEGPPDELPTEGDFSTEAHGLGASYEAAGRRRSPGRRHLLAQGVHPAHATVSRPLSLLHVRDRAGPRRGAVPRTRRGSRDRP
jgi:hypothetical protein